MREINSYNSLGVQEKHLEMGLHRAASLQCKPQSAAVTERAGALCPVKHVTSFNNAPRGPVRSCKSQPCENKQERSTSTFRSEWIHLSRYSGRSGPSHSPGSHTLLTRDQNLISRKSGSSPPHPHGRPEDPTVTRQRSRRVKLSTQPAGHFHCGGGWRETWPLPWIHNCCSAGISRGVPVQHFSSVLSFIHYFNFTGSLPRPGLPSEVDKCL